MDKIAKYKAAIKKVMLRHAEGEYYHNYSEYETQLIMDEERGHYMLLGVGWQKSKRIHGCTIHIDLKGDKVWLQQDWTDSIIAEQLMELGVAKEDIVLGFYSPFRRVDTGFAVA